MVLTSDFVLEILKCDHSNEGFPVVQLQLFLSSRHNYLQKYSGKKELSVVKLIKPWSRCVQEVIYYCIAYNIFVVAAVMTNASLTSDFGSKFSKVNS